MVLSFTTMLVDFKLSNQKIIPSDFTKLQFITTPALSPDGKRIAFTIKSVNNQTNKYRAPIFLAEIGKDDQTDKYRQFTSGLHVDIFSRFSPCGKYLGFISTRMDKKKQVFVMSTTGGEAFQITRFPNGVKDWIWSFDSNYIHVIAQVDHEDLEEILHPELEVEISYVLDPATFEANEVKKNREYELKKDPRVIQDAFCREEINYLDNRYRQPFIIPIPKPLESPKQKKHPIRHIGEFGYHYDLGTFNLDTTAVYLTRHIGDPTLTHDKDLIKVELDNPKDQQIIGQLFGFVQNMRLSPDGRYLSIEGIRKEVGIYDNMNLLVYDLVDNPNKEFKSVTDSFDRSVSDAQWISETELLFRAPDKGQINIHRVNVKTSEIRLVVGGDTNINAFSVSTNGERIAYEVSHNTFPSDLFWCNSDGSNEKRLTTINKKFLDNHSIANTEAFTYQRDDIEFQGWIYLPSNHNGIDKLPVVIEIHGGPAVMWSPHEKTLWHEWNTLVSSGYAVVFCNPRGSDGYGIDFRAGVFKNWGDDPGNDILLALDTALEKYPFLDNTRVAVTGGSYGGYMTGWLVTHSTRFKAAVSQRGVYEFAAFGMTTDIPNWLEKQYDFDLIADHTKPWADAPLSAIKNLQTPLLILHAENDFRVPIATAEQLFWAAKKYGKIVEFVRYPREGHELSRSGEPRHIIDRIQRIDAWFHKFL